MEKLVKSILNNNFKPLTVSDFFVRNIKEKNVFMRHDVDRRPEKALEMAILENDLNFKSTYYFRTISETYKEDIILQIKDLGHEIGYHYEVMARNKGQKREAIRMFEKELQDMRQIVPIDTICWHGSPLSKWPERNLWDDYQMSDYGVLGDAFLSIDYSNLYYFTDTGRRWDDIFSVRDKMYSLSSEHRVKNTFELIELLPNLENSVGINVHPQRWCRTNYHWFKEYASQNLKNLGKYFLKTIR
jgi:hypothetical protein